jgi:hypothetical protein
MAPPSNGSSGWVSPPRPRSPAERGVEFAAAQRRLKEEAAERRAAAAAAAPPAPRAAARGRSSKGKRGA